MGTATTSNAGPGCIAHRGASGTEPENTLRAFRRALDMGASWLELDVRFAHDRVLVLHDATVDRTTNGLGAVTALDLAVLRGLDAGAGERIPFLEEVLELVRGRAGLHVELKGSGTAGPTAAVLGAALRSGGWRSRDLVVSSFDWEQLAEFSALLPAVPVAVLGTDREGQPAVEAAMRLGATAVHLEKWAVRGVLVDDAHQRGLAVRVYTVNDRWEYEFMRRLDVDDVFTDHPDRVLDWRGAGRWAGAASP